MDIKLIVKDICEVKSVNRVEYIINFLRENNIAHNVQKYIDGINIEIIRKGKNTNKEIIFFAHHDIYNNSIEGANDNTSSVAVLLTLAKFLYFYEPFYTINIVFNDYEELIGGIFSQNNSKDKIDKILKRIGSFQYLKSKISLKKSYVVFVLELSGIGNCLYFANKSGNIICDSCLNTFLVKTAEKLNFKYLNIPISLSDIVSSNYFGIKGTVFGSIPLIDGKNYIKELYSKGFSKEIYPYVWKKNHTSMDKYYSIQEKSLNMVYKFAVEIIKNIDQI